MKSRVEMGIKSVRGCLERVLGVRTLMHIYDQIEHRSHPEEFLTEALDLLGVRAEIRSKDAERISSSGPVVLVCNHPFGGLDGMLLAQMALQVRRDVRILANPVLGAFEELRELFYFIRPYQDPESMRANVRATLEAMRWVQGGGMLIVFPAGEVSSFSWKRWRVQDREWDGSVARIVRKTRASVIPARIQGRNGPWFQFAGMIHPSLRTLLLPREILNKRHAKIEIRIGKPIAFDKLPTELSDRDLTAYLRLRSDLLLRRSGPAAAATKSTGHQRLAPHAGTQRIARDVDRLPPSQKLVESQASQVFVASANQIPDLLEEIGRLREKTFRRVGEGTGRSVDLDPFDRHYLHLFAWNRERSEVIGAYRIGQTDAILQEHGVRGLYTHQLFNYGEDFLRSINPGLELGRSFVRPKYQKSILALSLLWKGITRFIAQNPHYRYLFGPVSMSNDYSHRSKDLLVHFFERNNFDSEISRMVSPRKNFQRKRFQSKDDRILRSSIRGLDDLSALIGEIEFDQEGMPMLFKHYMRLGAKVLSFNVDPKFGHSLDALIRLDLPRAERKLIQNYMGREAFDEYAQFHRVSSTLRTERGFVTT